MSNRTLKFSVSLGNIKVVREETETRSFSLDKRRVLQRVFRTELSEDVRFRSKPGSWDRTSHINSVITSEHTHLFL